MEWFTLRRAELASIFAGAPRVGVSPDGERYLAMARPDGSPGAEPFNLRWLLPALCGRSLWAWTWVSRASILLAAPLAWWYTGSPFAAAAIALPGIWWCWRAPVMVDPAGQALALLAACLAHRVHPLAALPIVLVAGAVRETTPVWAAAWAWNPLLLVGLAVPLARKLIVPAGPDVLDEMNAEILRHPVRAGLVHHRGQWTSLRLMVAPWSGLVLGLVVLAHFTWGFGGSVQLACALTLAYGQLLIATDRERLYQWAWPSLALACTVALPPVFWPFIALSLIFNPWR